MTKIFDILIVGIGGQGTILASNILGEACLLEGRHVKGAETHGMAQRGGSVETHIRIDGLYGPLIVPGTADLLISFDLLEALRYSHYLKNGGKMVVNRQMVLPTSVFTQKTPIPTESEITGQLARFEPCLIDADRIADRGGQQPCPERGDPRCGLVVDPLKGRIPACGRKKTRPAKDR